MLVLVTNDDGIGAKGLRALSLVAELAYGEPASLRDPVTFSFAHGGKDGTPYAVDRPTYDATVASLEAALRQARVGHTERVDALKRLAGLSAPGEGRRARAVGARSPGSGP